ncbi:MAG: sigma-70 family RNA polymerase sigma factor [Patescibacteria group bacterium]|nr:sigma-70 family RNA polymerase sigma factor [Patescibacteria group bacterium]
MKEEQELVKKAQKGEPEAFGVLYDKHLTPIYRFIFLKVGNKADAEDLCHQVFLSAWKNIGRYRFQGFPFSSWLYKIASNTVIDHWRTKKNNTSIELVAESLLSESPKLDHLLDQKLEVQLIKTSLIKLESEQQNVIIMRFVDELTNKEIAQILGKSEGAIRVIQHRAIKRLRKHISDHNHHETENA